MLPGKRPAIARVIDRTVPWRFNRRICDCPCGWRGSSPCWTRLESFISRGISAQVKELWIFIHFLPLCEMTAREACSSVDRSDRSASCCSVLSFLMPTVLQTILRRAVIHFCWRLFTCVHTRVSQWMTIGLLFRTKSFFDNKKYLNIGYSCSLFYMGLCKMDTSPVP